MKPHLYFWHGAWWISCNGRASFRSGITLNDLPHDSFYEARCDAEYCWGVVHTRYDFVSDWAAPVPF